MHFLLERRNTAFAYKVQGLLHDTFMFECHFFPMPQAFTRPDLKRNRSTETNVLRFPHCLAAWGQELPTSVPLLHPTWENKTSGWRHTSGNYRRSQSWARKALTVNYESPEAQWGQPVLKTPEGPIDGGTPTRLWGFPWGVQPGPHIKYQWENPLCCNRESTLFFLIRLHLGEPRNESLTHLGIIRA